MEIFDVAIVGGGPAALTAGLYVGRAGKTFALFEGDLVGGRIQETEKVDNIPGCPSVSGLDFSDTLSNQCCSLEGAHVFYTKITKISDPINNVYTLFGSGGDKYQARTIILATGTKPRTLGFPNEKEHIGEKIHFCALCDGAFYEGKEVLVVGGGNSALTEALILSELCSKVTILQNLPTLTAEKALIEKIEEKKNIEVVCGVKILNYYFDDKCAGIVAEGKIANQIFYIADAIFLAIGMVPQTGFVKNFVIRDGNGYIQTKDSHKTNKVGIYACGDCRADTYKQVVVACGDGASAALEALDYLRGII